MSGRTKKKRIEEAETAIVGPRLGLRHAPRDEYDLRQAHWARLYELLDLLYYRGFFTESEAKLMRQVTEKQLLVESLSRALRRYDIYKGLPKEEAAQIDWTSTAHISQLPSGKVVKWS